MTDTPPYAEYAKLAAQQFGLCELYEKAAQEIARAQLSHAAARHIEGLGRLLDIAHSTGAPDTLDPGTFETITFDALNGWKVAIFYDGGELDYIEHFITPTGKLVDFWDWPQNVPGREILINWRGLQDTERLRALLSDPAALMPSGSWA